jgi:regulator of nucleoside diphosphate kinase
MAQPDIIITRADFERLSKLLDSASASAVSDHLDAELNRAQIVEAEEVDRAVVTMHSRVTFRDDSTGETRTVSLVYPGEEDIDRGCISILTPIGTALLGLSEGQSIFWQTRTGESRVLTVLRLLSQGHEAA